MVVILYPLGLPGGDRPRSYCTRSRGASFEAQIKRKQCKNVKREKEKDLGNEKEKSPKRNLLTLTKKKILKSQCTVEKKILCKHKKKQQQKKKRKTKEKRKKGKKKQTKTKK